MVWRTDASHRRTGFPASSPIRTTVVTEILPATGCAWFRQIRFVWSRNDVAISVPESIDRPAGCSRVTGIGKPVSEHVHFEDCVVTLAVHC